MQYGTADVFSLPFVFSKLPMQYGTSFVIIRLKTIIFSKLPMQYGTSVKIELRCDSISKLRMQYGTLTC